MTVAGCFHFDDNLVVKLDSRDRNGPQLVWLVELFQQLGLHLSVWRRESHFVGFEVIIRQSNDAHQHLQVVID